MPDLMISWPDLMISWPVDACAAQWWNSVNLDKDSDFWQLFWTQNNRNPWNYAYICKYTPKNIGYLKYTYHHHNRDQQVLTTYKNQIEKDENKLLNSEPFFTV